MQISRFYQLMRMTNILIKIFRFLSLSSNLVSDRRSLSYFSKYLPAAESLVEACRDNISQESALDVGASCVLSAEASTVSSPSNKSPTSNS